MPRDRLPLQHPVPAAESAARVQQRRPFLTDPTHTHVFHLTPTHGSWRNQVELWFSVLARRFLKRGDFNSMQDFEDASPRLPWTTTTGVTRIRIAGPMKGLRSCEGLHSVKRDASKRQGRAWFATPATI